MKWLNHLKHQYSRSAFIQVVNCGFDAYDIEGNRYSINIPDSFKIYVEYRTKTRSHFNDIDFSEAEKILKFLKENQKARCVELEIGRSPLNIPGWAIHSLIKDIELHYKNYRNLKELRFSEKIKV